jgi:hypothetical protein
VDKHLFASKLTSRKFAQSACKPRAVLFGCFDPERFSALQPRRGVPGRHGEGNRRQGSVMKNCGYCGRENDDKAAHCRECGTEFVRAELPPTKPSEKSDGPGDQSAPMSPDERVQDLVILARCRTLLEADLLVSRLEAAGIPAFIPDQSLVQLVAWNVNTYGYVRVQVSSKDYEAARQLISTEAQDD